MSGPWLVRMLQPGRSVKRFIDRRGGGLAVSGSVRSVGSVVLTMIVSISIGSTVSAAPLDPTPAEAAARDAMGARLTNATVVWQRGTALYASTLADWQPTKLTPGGAEDSAPRWSPDGSRLLFVRAPGAVWVMNADFTGAEMVVPAAHTPSWTADGQAITAVNAQDEHQILRYDFSSEQTTVIYDSTDTKWSSFEQANDTLSQAAALHPSGRYLLTFTIDRGHNTYIIDLQEETILDNTEMDRGDCSPSWAPDGSYATTTARTSNRPVLRTTFAVGDSSLPASQHFVGIGEVCSCSYYVHGHRVSNDGRWMVMGGKNNDTGNREIYIWEIGQPESEVVRLTFDSAEDSSPTLFVGAAATCSDGDGDGYGDGDGCLGSDCDDGDPSIHPTALEVCDGIDQDCGGDVATTEVDGDGDGVRGCDGDCNDGDASIHPGATDGCNGVDDDCDGNTDPGCGGDDPPVSDPPDDGSSGTDPAAEGVAPMTVGCMQAAGSVPWLLVPVVMLVRRRRR